MHRSMMLKTVLVKALLHGMIRPVMDIRIHPYTVCLASLANQLRLTVVVIAAEAAVEVAMDQVFNQVVLRTRTA
ncbi:hypothetical protein D3C76_998450 [compost metagenome]